MLSEKIGTSAGLVWNTLIPEDLSVKALKKATQLKEKELYMALGWLAREGKIQFSEIDGELYVGLK